MHSSPTRDINYQWMRDHYEAHPRSTKCYNHHITSALWRHRRRLGDMAAISWT